MGGASPQWNDPLLVSPATVLIALLPVGWTGDWHGNPKPQWIVPLSGRWFVETTDGTRVEMRTRTRSLTSGAGKGTAREPSVTRRR